MFNNNERDKMDKTILVVEINQYSNGSKIYAIKKHANTLDKASEYLVSLKNLNEDKDISYELFNRFAQFEVDRIEKVANAKSFILNTMPKNMTWLLNVKLHLMMNVLRVDIKNLAIHTRSILMYGQPKK
jgi:hypothetical protein